MTPEQLAAIGERANKATPGNWYVSHACGGCFVNYEDVRALGGAYGDSWNEDDAAFVVHARQDVPALLAYVRRLQTEASDLRHQLASTQTAANLARGITERARQEKDEAKGEADRLREALREHQWSDPADSHNGAMFCQGCGEYMGDKHAADCWIENALNPPVPEEAATT